MTAKSLFVAQLACVIESGLHADYSTGVQMTAMIAAEHAAELKTCDMHTATAAVPGMTQKQHPPYLCCMRSFCGQGSNMCTWMQLLPMKAGEISVIMCHL